MRRMVDLRCATCAETQEDRYVDVATLPAHEGCGGTWEAVMLPGRPNAVIGDDIPGGLLIRNGLCHEDGTPRKFYSKSEIKREAKARGLTWGATEHVPSRGSDKNPHTTAWR